MKRLDALSGLAGLRAAALVGHDGLPIEAQGELGDVLSAELASLQGYAERLTRRLGAGQVSRLTFTSDTAEVVALVVGEFVLGAALARGTDTRPAQQVLARLALGFQGLPSPEDRPA